MRCLFTDSQGRLWVGTNDNGMVLMEQEVIRAWTEEDGLPASSLRAIVEGPDGTMYVATTGGLVMVDKDLELRTPADSRVANVFVQDLRVGADGRIYGLTNEGVLFVMNGDAIDCFLERGDLIGDGANCIFPDPPNPGRVYVEMTDETVYYGELEAGIDSMEKIDISPLSQVQRFEYIDGKIWICARNGIGVLYENSLYVLEDLPMDNSIGHVITDYAGNLWFTSTRQGVMKIVPNRFVDINARYELENGVVNSTCMLDGLLYIATDMGLRVVDGETSVTSLPLTEARSASGADLGTSDLIEYLADTRIRSIIRDSQDRLWFSTWRKHGLLRYDHGKLFAFTSEDGLFSDHIRSICELSDGRVAVAVSGGVNVIEGDAVVAGYGEGDGMANAEILCVEEGIDGEILCGSDGDGIYVIGTDGVRNIGKEDGLKSEVVMRIKRDPARKVFWLVTGNSLGFLNADYQVRLIGNFPYSNNFDLYENSNGEMWVLGSNGVYIASGDKMVENREIGWVHYGISDGLPCVATANSYSELTEDGALYIAGSTGVVRVNIDAPFSEIRDLKASIPYVEADGERLYPDTLGRFSIPASVKKLTIYGYVFNYSLVNPDINYRLEGFDDAPATVSCNDFGAVDYTNLPGGDYRFVMELRDSVHQQWKIFSAVIVKDKKLTEQPWFYIGASVGGALILGLAVQAYVRRKMRQLEEKNREEAEKERITNELSMAKQIQESVLPNTFPAFPDRTDIDVYATMEPARDVGGDFYDFFLIDEDHLCMVMADVSGKGIPAALFMMVSKSILKNSAMLGISPAEILTKVNQTICSNNSMDMFVTVWLGILDLTNGRLVASNAGHEYPVLRKAGQPFEFVKDRHGLVIGAMEESRYSEYELTLEPGDALFLYTDGLAEATNAEEELFGADRIIEALSDMGEASPRQVLETAHAAVDVFVKEAEQFDDLTMMCVEYKG